MKVMFVIPYFYPAVGGLENYARQMTRGFLERGDEVIIVTTNHEERRLTEDTVDGMRVIRLPRMFKISNTPINPFWYFSIRAIIRREKPDVINGHTPVPFIADVAERVRGRIPYVLTYQNDLAKPAGIMRLLAACSNFLFTAPTLKRSDLIITSSRYYIDKSPFLNKWRHKVAVVTPGADIRHLHSNLDAAWLRNKFPDKKLVLFVGSLKSTHRHKGVEVLLRAFAQVMASVPEAILLLAGAGDDVSLYQDQSAALGISPSVHFAGFVPDEMLANYYSGSDICVLPSTSEAEGFGMVLIEAMACGTPAIASRIGGMPYVIESTGGGVLVEPGNAAALAEKIVELLMNPAYAKSLGEVGQKRVVAKFSVDTLSKQYATTVASTFRAPGL